MVGTGTEGQPPVNKERGSAVLTSSETSSGSEVESKIRAGGKAKEFQQKRNIGRQVKWHFGALNQSHRQ